ncbi:MAG: DUF4271 domain-containing protein [Verrucomicrobia bacterium]|nr:DUF4271 domain-containing protein [Prolixibacteraceae bacterium]
MNQSGFQTNFFESQEVSENINLLDSALLDSLNAHYVAPDSVIYFSTRPEWSQFRKPYDGFYNYQKNLLEPLPYDSLHTVLKGVEVVFPGKKLSRNNPDWLVGVLVAAFFLFATVRLIFNKYLSLLAQATINYSTFTRVFRERYFNLLHASFRLDIIFNFIFALFWYQFLSTYRINFGIKDSFVVYLICVGSVIGYFFLKRLAYMLTGLMTESKREVKEYLFSMTVYNRILGLFLLPVTAIIAFVPVYQPELFLFLGLGIVAIFYLLSLRRGAKIFLRKHFSILYLILYLCTLEFLPLLLIYNLLLIG